MDLQFSVAMCVYGNDNPAHFSQALDSLASQTLLPDELVLVVDGPIPDEIEQVISGFHGIADFKVIRLAQNIGHGGARRESVAHCTHPYIAIADADDINLPNRFETQMAVFAKDCPPDVVGGAITKFVGDPSNIVATVSLPQHHDQIVRFLRKRSPVAQTTVMFTRAIYEKANGYLDWYAAEDYYLWIRMFLAGATFYNLPDELVSVRVSHDQHMRRGGWRYFKSTAGLSWYLHQNGIIGLFAHAQNILPRFVLQVLLPARLRGLFRNKLDFLVKSKKSRKPNEQTRFLYELTAPTALTEQTAYDAPPFEISVFRPTLFKPSLLPNRWLHDMVWFLLTGGAFRIYYVEQNNAVVHNSYVIPRCLRFPFLKRGDLHIGPCNTVASHRGQGLYPFTLRKIIKDHPGQTLYMIASEGNHASDRGMRKVGFERTGIVHKKGLFGAYTASPMDEQNK